jgi:hypothetical protein
VVYDLVIYDLLIYDLLVYDLLNYTSLKKYRQLLFPKNITHWFIVTIFPSPIIIIKRRTNTVSQKSHGLPAI